MKADQHEDRRQVVRLVLQHALQMTGGVGVLLLREGHLRECQPGRGESLVERQRPLVLGLRLADVFLGGMEAPEERHQTGVSRVLLDRLVDDGDGLVGAVLTDQRGHLGDDSGGKPGVGLEGRVVLLQRFLGLLVETQDGPARDMARRERRVDLDGFGVHLRGPPDLALLEVDAAQQRVRLGPIRRELARHTGRLDRLVVSSQGKVRPPQLEVILRGLPQGLPKQLEVLQGVCWSPSVELRHGQAVAHQIVSWEEPERLVELAHRLVRSVGPEGRLAEEVPGRRDVGEAVDERPQGLHGFVKSSIREVELTQGEDHPGRPGLTWQLLQLLDRVGELPFGGPHRAQGETNARTGGVRRLRFGQGLGRGVYLPLAEKKRSQPHERVGELRVPGESRPVRPFRVLGPIRASEGVAERRLDLRSARGETRGARENGKALRGPPLADLGGPDEMKRRGVLGFLGADRIPLLLSVVPRLQDEVDLAQVDAGPRNIRLDFDRALELPDGIEVPGLCAVRATQRVERGSELGVDLERVPELDDRLVGLPVLRVGDTLLEVPLLLDVRVLSAGHEGQRDEARDARSCDEIKPCAPSCHGHLTRRRDLELPDPIVSQSQLRHAA